MASKNLWADLSQLEIVRTPRTVLLEQAQYLTQAAKGILEGRVDDESIDVAAAGFRYDLNVRVPALNNFLVTVLWIEHGLELYPVRLMARRPVRDVSCANEAEFEKAIESILTSPEVKTVLSRLLSQVK